MHIVFYPGHGLFRLIGDVIDDSFGEWVSEIFFASLILLLLLAHYLSRGYYRRTGLYKRIRGKKAKPCLYDEDGNRILNPDGTPIEQPKEEQEAQQEPQEADAGGDAREGEQESKDE